MKKILLLTFAAIFPFILNAAEVSSGMAMSFAAEFFNCFAPTTASDVSLCNCGFATKASSARVPYYVFNREGGGYVIISAESRMSPIVAFSEDGYFDPDNIIPSMKNWLCGVEKTVAAVRSGKLSTNDGQEWNDKEMLVRLASSDNVCLNTVEWNQNSPFNASCPVVAGSTSVTGCVPLAASIVMCYYGWPEKGTGTLPSYSFTVNGTTYKAGGYTLGTVYDWSSLQALLSDTEASAASSTVKKNLARLIADVGQALKAAYSPGGTSATTTSIVPVAGEYFGYNKAAQFKRRDEFTADDWYSMIKQEIDYGRPLICDGTLNGGHCFIFDGYVKDQFNFVHVNWGWGPWANGYMNLNSNYYDDQGAIFDFYPDTDGSSEAVSGGLYVRGGAPYYFSAVPDKSSGSFSTDVRYISNDNRGDFKGYACLGHIDKNGELKEFICPAKGISLASGYRFSSPITFYDCKMTESTSWGDGIALFYSYGVDGPWIKSSDSYNGTTASVYPLMEYPFINSKDTYSTGERFDLRIKNFRRAYMWSSTSEDAGSQGLISKWEFFLDGECRMTVNDYGCTRDVVFDAPGTWIVKCTLSTMDGTPCESIVRKITVN